MWNATSRPSTPDLALCPDCATGSGFGSVLESLGSQARAGILQGLCAAGALAAFLVGTIRNARQASRRAREDTHRYQDRIEELECYLGLLDDL